jgi:RND family efflux transporter MFP subunit
MNWLRKNGIRSKEAPPIKEPLTKARSVWSAAHSAAFRLPKSKLGDAPRSESGGIRRTPNASRGSLAPAARWALCGLLITCAAALLLAGCGQAPNASSHEQQLYTCGMHPQVIQDKPGNCPICGMKLTPIRKQTGGAPGATNVSPVQTSIITIDPVTTQNMDLRTAAVTRGPLRRIVRTVGIVDFAEAAQTEVTTKFKGWIEKLYVDYTGQQVHHGEPLFEVYAPDLYSAETEYVLAMEEATSKGGVGAELIKKSALDKLRYFDISEEQIAELEKSRQVRKTLRVSAPRDGIVVEKMVLEGQMVEAGMKLYRLADLGTVWVQSQVYEQDLPLVKLGQEATVSLSYLPDRKFRGRVTFIYPTVDEKTRTVRVRMEFHNPGFFLKPGMFATVELTADLAESALLVPDMAVLRSGERNTAFVALDGGKFEPRALVLGPRSENNQYEVLSGLNEGERVVTSGQFMLDSESQLREAIQKMQPGAAMASAQPSAPARTSNVATNTRAPEKIV